MSRSARCRSRSKIGGTAVNRSSCPSSRRPRRLAPQRRRQNLLQRMLDALVDERRERLGRTRRKTVRVPEPAPQLFERPVQQVAAAIGRDPGREAFGPHAPQPHFRVGQERTRVLQLERPHGQRFCNRPRQSPFIESRLDLTVPREARRQPLQCRRVAERGATRAAAWAAAPGPAHVSLRKKPARRSPGSRPRADPAPGRGARRRSLPARPRRAAQRAAGRRWEPLAVGTPAQSVLPLQMPS